MRHSNEGVEYRNGVFDFEFRNSKNICCWMLLVFLFVIFALTLVGKCECAFKYSSLKQKQNMTDSENNKYRMYLSTEKTLDESETLWAGVPALVLAKTTLSTNIAAIGDYNTQLLSDGTGQTLIKNQNRDNLEDGVLKLSGGLVAHFTAEGQVAMRKDVTFKPYQVNRAKDIELYNMAHLLVKIALPVKTQLEKYYIFEADIVELDALHTAFLKSIPGKRDSVGSGTAARLAMRLLFKETDVLIKDQLDNLMVIYRAAKPEFYSKYGTARVIVDLGHGKKAGNSTPGTPATTTTASVNGKVYDTETEAGLVGAKVMIEGRNLTTTADAQGLYSLTTVPGTYTLLAEKEGFEAYSDDIVLEAGDALELDLGMDKIA
jgi:hypothetical protein